MSYRKMYGKEEGRQKMKKDYDEIRIEDLEVFANHGVFPEENVLGQKFLVSGSSLHRHTKGGTYG